MILTIIFLVSILILSGFYFLYYSPKKRIQDFARHAQQLGYKVKLMPYQFMRYFIIKYLRQQQKTLRVFKQEFKQYDLIVGNMFTSIAIIPININILKDTFNQLNKLPKNPFIAETFQEMLNGGGLVFSEGQGWKTKRRIISSVFHFDFLNDMIPIINEEIEAELKLIDKNIKQNKTSNLKITSVKILSSVIAKSFFGTDMNEYKIDGTPYCQKFMQFLDQVGSYGSSLQHMIFGMFIYKYGLSSLSRKLKKKYDVFCGIAKQITLNQLEKIKKKQKIKKNLLTSLYQNGLLNLDQNNVHKDKLNLYGLIGQFFTFFSAGTDTTANTINLIFHYLSQNPKYIKMIREENQAIQRNTSLTEPQKLKSMKWIDAILNEALRLNGPVSSMIPRKAIEDIQLDKLKLLKGSTVAIMPMLNHYRTQNFQQSQKFYPQRWMQEMKIEPFAYSPFGGGQRNCIGQYLARIQAKLLISKIVEKYDIKSLHPIIMSVSFVYATKYGDFQIKLKQN